MSNIQHTDGDSLPPPDSYLTIEGTLEAEIKILGSRFLSVCIGIRDAESFQQSLEKLKKEHHSATHYCFAWRLGPDGIPFRFSDDGEPSGTAGKRILGTIERFGFSDVGVIVIRYFGGTKLGMGGLSHAYSDATEAVLRNVKPVERLLLERFTIHFPYDRTSQIHHILDSTGTEVLDRQYGTEVTYTVQNRRSKTDSMTKMLVEITNNSVRIENIPA